MTAGDSISASDRDLMKRLTIALSAIFIFAAAFALLERTYSAKFFDISGQAQWIWAQHRMNANEPVAFFAARDFDLPERRYFTRLKILGDPEYTVFINGREIATRFVGEERQLDYYDISTLVKTGRNRIVVAVRSPQGVGGLLAGIDIAPETLNWMVTNAQWKIYRAWDPRILIRDVPSVPSERPFVIGEPPIGRWNYLTLRDEPLSRPPAAVVPPRDAFELIGLIPSIRTKGGVAVAGTEKARATAFDFGFTKGRIRLTASDDAIASRLFNIRFAYDRSELGYADAALRPVVFAPGEHVVTTSETHSFRYVTVFGKNVRAEVVQ